MYDCTDDVEVSSFQRIRRDDRKTIRALIVSDPHLLGRRRGSPADQMWIDWQVKRSVEFAIARHQPTDLIMLGDAFDEGRSTPIDVWEDEYAKRFERVFTRACRRAGVRLHNVAGNHDIGNFYQLRRSFVDRSFGSVVGSTNWQKWICTDEGGACVRLVSVNSMALHASPNGKMAPDTLAFLDTVSMERAHSHEPVVLLTHMPMFRSDDTECGHERSLEGGHVTYVSPETSLKEREDVISKELSDLIIERLQPSLVLSGHLHAVCRHKTHNASFLELTTPAFGWRMRPDPGYMVVEFTPTTNGELIIQHALLCPLPHEHVTLAIVLIMLSMSILLLFYALLRAFCAHRSRVHAKNKTR